MKKFLFAIACVFGMTACSNNSNVNTEVVDSTEVVTDSVVNSVDTVAVDSVM